MFFKLNRAAAPMTDPERAAYNEAIASAKAVVRAAFNTLNMSRDVVQDLVATFGPLVESSADPSQLAAWNRLKAAAMAIPEAEVPLLLL